MKQNDYNLKQNKDSPYIDMKCLDEFIILIIERSRIREYMMLTDSKRRLFFINFVAGLGKGFGQAIGLTLLAAIAFYFLSGWIKLPIIGEYIAKLLDVVENYRNK